MLLFIIVIVDFSSDQLACLIDNLSTDHLTSP